jgi:hypothetical protein
MTIRNAALEALSLYLIFPPHSQHFDCSEFKCWFLIGRQVGITPAQHCVSKELGKAPWC